MSEDIIELKNAVESAKNTLVSFQNEHKDALKKAETETAEFKSKAEKMADDIASGVEAQQKMKLEIDRLSALSNSGIGEKTEKFEGISLKEDGFGEFMRKDGQHTYSEFLQTKNNMSTAIQVDGGYLTNVQRMGILQNRINETSSMRQICTVVSTSQKAAEWVCLDGTRVSTNKTNENGTRSATNTRTISKLEISTHIKYAQPAVTTSMLDDVPETESLIMDWAAEDFALDENTDFVSGLGVDCAKGILSYTAGTVGTYAKNSIAQKNMGAAAALTANGVMDVQASIKEAYQMNATWLMNRSTFKDLLLLTNGIGNYLFNLNLDKSVQSPFNLLTRPVVFASDMPVVGANALSIAYGDFRKAYVIVDRKGVSLLRDPFSAKGFVSFYFEKRTGGAVANFEAIVIGKVAV